MGRIQFCVHPLQQTKPGEIGSDPFFGRIRSYVFRLERGLSHALCFDSERFPYKVVQFFLLFLMTQEGMIGGEISTLVNNVASKTLRRAKRRRVELV